RIVRFVGNVETLTAEQRQGVIGRILTPDYQVTLAGPIGGAISLADVKAFANATANPLFKADQTLESDTEVDTQVQVLERIVRFVGNVETLTAEQRQGVIGRILTPDYQVTLAGPIGGAISLADVKAFANATANPLFKADQTLESDTEVDTQVQVLERTVGYAAELETLS